jgi:hypothetical protein
MTFAIPIDLDRRIKAAFVATQYDEGRETFAGMMEELVLAEARRLESVHNDGMPFPTERKLKRGRPFA